MKSDRQLLRKYALINSTEYQQMIESLKRVNIQGMDYVCIANMLVKRKSSAEESALKGILKQQGIPANEVQTIVASYLKNRIHLQGR